MNNDLTCPECGSENIHTIGEWWECDDCSWTESIENMSTDEDNKDQGE